MLARVHQHGNSVVHTVRSDLFAAYERLTLDWKEYLAGC